ncbi:unnamed protein product [Rotaria socialis]|uniref:Uncharacterized protein n=1 Tax=Rotaria socialis TaxID=392032 RepID=A0A818CEP3_9BILA|nr:unnamed protein product [Rotaria socialis]
MNEKFLTFETLPDETINVKILIFSRYIYSLTILDTLLQQLDIDNLPYLEYLSIPDVLFEYDLAFIDFITTETRRQLRKLVLNALKNRYRSRLIIN